MTARRFLTVTFLGESDGKRSSSVACRNYFVRSRRLDRDALAISFRSR